MDGQQFDRLTQQFGRALSRRRFGAALAALGLGAGSGAESYAKPKKKKKKRKPKPCANGTVRCGGACVDSQTNTQHCGGCGQPCPSGQPCAGGECQDGGCSGDRELCGTECVNLDNDEQNCGACGVQCTGDLTCLSGECGCAEGTKCGNRCVNVGGDDAHCGQCDRACGGDLTCLDGECACASGTQCGNDCVNTQTNRNHCGECGNACDPDQSCSGGECLDPPECVDWDGCGGYGGGANDLVCRDGRCVCATEGEGLCRRHPDRSGLCDKCCPGGSGQCPFDEVCYYKEDYLGRPYGYCDCPTGWQRCNYTPHPSGTCVEDPMTDSRKCGPFCEDCTANTTFPAICCNGGCTRGCNPGSYCFDQDQPCGPNCLPCGSDSICCNMGPGTLPRCIPNVNGSYVCYQN